MSVDLNTQDNFPENIPGALETSDPLQRARGRYLRCFIVGGGSSLSGFDFSSLDDEFVISVNGAFEFCKANAAIGIDKRYWSRLYQGGYGDKALRKAQNPKLKKYWVETPAGQDIKEIPNEVIRISSASKQKMVFTQNLNDGLISGGNSGFAALNLAVAFGFRLIYLLGFDMKGDGKGNQAWFHKGHPNVQKEDVYLNFIKPFEAVAPELKKRGIHVINVNEESKLTCFPFEEFPSRSRVSVPGFRGFGDHFYMRTLVESLARKHLKVSVQCTMPEAFWDYPNVEFTNPPTELRTQKKHILSLDNNLWGRFDGLPKVAETPVSYDWKNQLAQKSNEKSVAYSFAKLNGVNDFDFGFPVPKVWGDRGKEILKKVDNPQGKPVCIVHQSTIRKEWDCPSRSPKPEYFQHIVSKYKKQICFVSVLDVDGVNEIYDGEQLEGISTRFEHGELSIPEIIGLCAESGLILSYPSFFMLLGVALRTPTFVLWGGHISPEIHLDPIMGLEKTDFVSPIPACNCGQAAHDCLKEIPINKIDEGFQNFLLKNKLVDVQEAKEVLKKVSKEIEKKEEKKSYFKEIQETTRVAIPAGIGDMHWILLKLEDFKRKRGIKHLTISAHEDSGHKNSHEFLKMLHYVDAVEDPGPDLPWPWIGGKNNPDFPLREDVNGLDFLMQFNSSLEKGVSIQDILPEYEIDWEYQIPIFPESIKSAKNLCLDCGKKVILFYASSVGGNNNWAKGFWRPEDWNELAKFLISRYRTLPILLGSNWDLNYCELLNLSLMRSLVGKTNVSELFALTQMADAVVSFPSGVSIMSTHFKTPSIMFWPQNQWSEKFSTAWVDPKMLSEKKYIPIHYAENDFCNVDFVANQLVKFLEIEDDN